MITKLTTKNFVGVDDGSHNFGAINRLTGHNGSGKTSLGRAMLFALTGLSPQLTSAGADYIADPALVMSIELETSLGVISCKRNKSSRQVTIDKLPVTDAVLEQKFGMPLFALGCMFWPESFFSLPTQKRRDIFMAITPNQDFKAIFASITENIDPNIITWDMPAKTLQMGWAAKRLQLEREVAKLQGQHEEIHRNTVTSVADTGELQKNLASMQLELNTLSKQHDLDIAQSITAARFEGQFEIWKSVNLQRMEAIKENAIRKARALKLQDASVMKKEVEAVQELNRKSSDHLNLLDSSISAAKKRLAKAEIIPETCDKCGQKWPHSKPDTTRETDELDRLNKDRDAQIQLISEIAGQYRESVDKLARIESANRLLEPVQLLDIAEATMPPEKTDTPDPDLIRKNKERIAELTTQLSETKQQFIQLTALQTQSAAHAQRLIHTKKELDKLAAELDIALQIEKALHPKTGVWAIALKQKLASIVLPGFDFKFSETQANGEEKDAFIVVRKEDGCQIESMSSGEKIKFCLALSKLIAELTGSAFKSVFLEHTDLLDQVPSVKGFQVFAERVSKEGLKVEVIK